MRIFRLYTEGYIDQESEFEYKHLMKFREFFPLLHDHDYFELFIITEGSIRHAINGKSTVLEKGHMVFIRPDDFHQYRQIEKQDCQMINIAIMEKTIRELFGYLGKGFDENQLISPKSPPMVLLTESELSQLLIKFQQLNTLPVYDKKRLNTAFRIILVHIFSNFFLNFEKSDNKNPEWLQYTITELQKPDNFKKGISALKEIACKSDEHISRSVKKYLNKTPTKFINELRLNYAANQIRFTSRNIADIAFEAGFENQSHFHRQFKKFLNHTPNEFRKINNGLAV